MPLYESPAIVLRGMKLGEADRIVTFFTLRYGKLKAVAKGAARPKSRFGGRIEPFVHGNLIAFGKEKTDLLRLNACDVIEPFSALRDDFDRLNRAFVSAEMVDVCQKERDVNAEGFHLLLDLWRGLSSIHGPTRLDLMLRLFQIKYLSIIGYQPGLDRCVHCGGAIRAPEAGFNAVKGGAVCGGCLSADPSAVRVSAGSVRLMAKSLTTPSSRLVRLTAGADTVRDIARCVTESVRAHIRRELRSERFLVL